MHITKTSAKQSATLQEIASQAEVWQESLSDFQRDGALDGILESSRKRTEWLFLGCGTSFYLAEAAAASWTLLTGERARALPASEPLLFPELTFAEAENLQSVIISRSGQTSEALRAANVFAREFHVPTLGVTCAAGSPLAEMSDLTLCVSRADEKSMVMTRSFTSMLLALQQLAATKAGEKDFSASLVRMATHFASAGNAMAERVQAFVERHSFADYVFLGQGPFHSIAREAALKVMEMSCSYSQAFHSLEFRHGPKAIVSSDTCLMFFLSERGSSSESEVLSEVKELGGVTIAVCNRANDVIRQSSDLVFDLGFDGPELSTLVPSVVPAQLLGFFTGIKKNLNPDSPRNLTRVVILD